MGVAIQQSQMMPAGIVMRRSPGVTRWAKWAWKATAVLPGAGPASWREIREEGDVTEFHAGTLNITLYVSDTEAYAHELSTQTPSVYIVLRNPEHETDAPLDLVHVTVSPYEAQDYCDSGEELVEKVPMPPALLQWVADYVHRHHVEEPFVKRRRNKARTDRIQNGVGDPRIAQPTDVYRAPSRAPSEVSE